eukprot:s2396_g12.t2
MLAPTTAGRSTLLGIIGMALLLGVATTMHQEALRLQFPSTGRRLQQPRQLPTPRLVQMQPQMPVAAKVVQLAGSMTTGTDHNRWPFLTRMGFEGLLGLLDPCCRLEGLRPPQVAAAATQRTTRKTTTRTLLTTQCAARTTEDEDAASLTWSETSLVLEGPSLAHSKEVLYSLYRRELQDKAAEEEQAWSSPSGRRTAPIGWFAVQQLARQRLSGARALEWRMKALDGRSLQGMWQKWRAYASFQRASRALRQQSRQHKAAFHQAQLQHAEVAAQKGDHRGLFQVIKQLAPRRTRGVSRLKGAEGHLLSAQAELQAVLTYSKETFARLQDEAPQLPIADDLVFHEEDLSSELAALNPYRAVPQHIAPNAAWHLCAGTLCSKLPVALNRHFRAGSPDMLQGDMKDAYACICTSLVYSLEVVGLTPAGTHKVLVLATKHVRAILRQLAHITHMTDAEIWQAAALEPPGQLVLKRLSNFCAKRNPLQSPSGSDIVINDHIPASLLLLRDGLTAALQHSPEPATQVAADTHPFPHCPKELVTAHALRIHLALQHWSHPRPEKERCPQAALQDPTVQIMGKLLLRHEEFISHLRKDMGFILFFEQDKHSVLPSLMDVAKAHREKLDQGNTEIKSPLRTLLLNCLLRELLQRTQQENQWNYLRWDTKQRRLVLQGNALTSLAGMSMKQDDLPQQHLAKLLGQEIYRRLAGIRPDTGC